MLEDKQLLKKADDNPLNLLRKLLSIKPVPFWYVRHGQTNWNLENRAMGHTDIPLNIHGERQAYLARRALVGQNITTICHSPLSRAKRTAEIINEELNCDLVQLEELKECGLGSYEGQLKGQWFRDWRGGLELPKAESFANFLDRALVGINKALCFPGTVLIVAHGGVYWAIEQALQIVIEGGLQNCLPIFHQPPQKDHQTWRLQKSLLADCLDE